MRSTFVTSLAWLSVSVTVPLLQAEAPDAPLEVKRMATAGLMAAARAIQASNRADHRAAVVPAFELTMLGRGRLAVYRALNIPGSQLAPLLIGFDGTRAIPLGGFEAPDLVTAASVAGLSLARDDADLVSTARWLAGIADPYGGIATEIGEVQVYREEVADSFAGVAGAATGRTACVVARSSTGDWVTTVHQLQYCFQADSDGQLVAWTRRRL